MRLGPLVLAFVVLAGCHDWEALSQGGADAGGACVAYVVAGDTHTCARETDGSLLCWGDNRFGQLGLGDTKSRSVPTVVPGVQVARIYLAAGEGELSSDRAVFTCAVRTDAQLACWGDNRNGQLGNGTTAPSSTPAVVAGLGGVAARASAGGGHACAQTSDGAVWCWGKNDAGQLGTGQTSAAATASPARVVGLPSGADAIAAGGSHTCAHLADGSLWCWGDNRYGQLGDGTTQSRATPMQVAALGTRVVRVTTGGSHTCASTTDGAMWCWGRNDAGQLGTGDTAQRSTPTAVSAPASNVAEVYAGGLHTCALGVSGVLWCWGDNRFGQLGLGDTNARVVPAQVASLGAVTAGYAGGAHTCALLNDASVWCWGNDQYGQIGVGGGPPRLAPTRVLAPCR